MDTHSSLNYVCVRQLFANLPSATNHKGSLPSLDFDVATKKKSKPKPFKIWLKFPITSR